MIIMMKAKFILHKHYLFLERKKYKIIKTTNYTYLNNDKSNEEEYANVYKSCGIIDLYEKISYE